MWKSGRRNTGEEYFSKGFLVYPELNLEGAVWVSQANGQEVKDGRRRVFKANGKALAKLSAEIYTFCCCKEKYKEKNGRWWGWKGRQGPKSRGWFNQQIFTEDLLCIRQYLKLSSGNRDEHMTYPHRAQYPLRDTKTWTGNSTKLWDTMID